MIESAKIYEGQSGVTLNGLFYPDSDGEPMGDNTKQTRWIVNLYNMLDAYYQKMADVFVAANLLWYPYKDDNLTRIGPDVLVVWGRAKGDRGSYIQSQENDIAPQVVFEVKSPGNSVAELVGKAELYAKYGSEEYYMYDPDKGSLRGWLLKAGRATELPQVRGWTSPRLGLKLDLDGYDLALFDPTNRRLLDYNQILNNFQQAERRASNAEDEIARLKKLLDDATTATQENTRLKELLRRSNLNPDDLL